MGKLTVLAAMRTTRQEMVFTKSMTFDAEEFPSVAIAAQPVSVHASAESDLIEKLQARDGRAFETLVERYSGDIFALLYRITENAEDAGDLTQETLLSALRSVHRFRGESGLKTWLFRIAINESRNRFRWWKRRRRDQTVSLDSLIGTTEMLVSDTIPDRGLSPEQETLRRERETALRSALIELPVVFREAVILCDIEGLSYEETALALKVGLGTVKSRISRGREELRRRLKGF
ncbi:MAG: sigma-70 family RNA polymerase sigma factor [Acidobacteriota bacterium]